MHCFRCGSPDRLWKACPNPYNPTKGNIAKGKGRVPGKKLGKVMHWADEATWKSDAEQWWAEGSNQMDAGSRHATDATMAMEASGGIPTMPAEGAIEQHDTDPWAAYYALQTDMGRATYFANSGLEWMTHPVVTDAST